jgi:hypothetical protein
MIQFITAVLAKLCIHVMPFFGALHARTSTKLTCFDEFS